MTDIHQFKKFEGKKVDSRFSVIKKHIRNKKILDCGAVAHKAIRESGSKWLHKRLREYADQVVGIDLEEEEISKLKERGYNIIHGNVENIDLDEKFDVVVVGELIEHLDNPGKFLENMKNHLRDGGYIILTTPNALMLRRFYEEYLKNGVTINTNHTCLFDEITLKQLLRRYDYMIEGIYYSEEHPVSLKHKIENEMSKIKPWISETLIIVAKKGK